MVRSRSARERTAHSFCKTLNRKVGAFSENLALRGRCTFRIDKLHLEARTVYPPEKRWEFRFVGMLESVESTLGLMVWNGLFVFRRTCYINKGYLHDDSPNNPNVTNKNYDLLVPLHFSFILSCLLSEELERANSERGTIGRKMRSM